MPLADLIVSPQHRLLVGGRGVQLEGAGAEMLVPAKSLVGLPGTGIRCMNGKRRIVWHHFACRSHHVVDAEGCLSESLLLGPMVLNGLPSADRRVLRRLFGRLPVDEAVNGPVAPPALTVRAAHRMLQARARRPGSTRAADFAYAHCG